MTKKFKQTAEAVEEEVQATESVTIEEAKEIVETEPKKEGLFKKGFNKVKGFYEEHKAAVLATAGATLGVVVYAAVKMIPNQTVYEGEFEEQGMIEAPVDENVETEVTETEAE